MTNFDHFLTDPQFTSFAEAAVAAEKILQIDLTACILNCRRAMECGVKWMYSVDNALVKPWQDTLVNLMNDGEFREIVGKDLWKRMDHIRRMGNAAAHGGKALTQAQAELCLENLYIFLDFVAYCYGTDYQEGQFDRVLLQKKQASFSSPSGGAVERGETERADVDLDALIAENQALKAELTARREEARRLCKVPEGKVCILSFGGSLGAQRVNEAVADVMAWHIKEGKLHHIHATGQYGVELLPRLLQDRKVPYSDNPCLDIREYIDDMPACLAAADLVICRAGASTLSELAAAGRASILIPSPNVAENHQYHNAMVLQNAGAAVVLQEKELTGEALVKLVKELTQDPARLRRLGENAKKIAAPRAVEEIADQLLALVQK